MSRTAPIGLPRAHNFADPPLFQLFTLFSRLHSVYCFILCANRAPSRQRLCRQKCRPSGRADLRRCACRQKDEVGVAGEGGKASCRAGCNRKTGFLIFRPGFSIHRTESPVNADATARVVMPLTVRSQDNECCRCRRCRYKPSGQLCLRRRCSKPVRGFHRGPCLKFDAPELLPRLKINVAISEKFPYNKIQSGCAACLAPNPDKPEKPCNENFAILQTFSFIRGLIPSP